MIQFNSIWDVISAYVLICAYFGVYRALDGDFELLLGFFMTHTIENNTKRMTASLPYPGIFKRPDGATNCSIMNSGGPVGDRGGFPSGHMAATTYFMSYLYFRSKDTSLRSKLYHYTPVAGMALARYMKGCHNGYQIVAGYLLGLGVAYWGDWVKRKYGADSLLKLNAWTG